MQKVSLRLGYVDFVRKQYFISDKAECESIFSDAPPKYTTRKEILQENNITTATAIGAQNKSDSEASIRLINDTFIGKEF